MDKITNARNEAECVLMEHQLAEELGITYEQYLHLDKQDIQNNPILGDDTRGFTTSSRELKGFFISSSPPSSASDEPTAIFGPA